MVTDSNHVDITVIAEGQHVTVPASDGSAGFVGRKAPCNGLHFSLGGNDGPCFFVPASVLREKLAELNHAQPALPALPELPESAPPAPPPPPEPERPTPMALWAQASRKPKRYEALLVKHGYLLPPSRVKRALIVPPKRRRR